MTTDRSAAARDLLQLMGDISQRCWNAGWLVGLEFALWNMIVAGTPASYGDGEVSIDQIAELRRLHNACDGWWYWDVEDDEERFVPTEQWTLILGGRPEAKP
jgi:hypothetical protein